ncbi:MAG TPA: hypothetical protein VEW71_08625 [Allosphingosinicella sp.]|nr:hypothetical protein [Allosphingosinicella sp.]
METHPSRPTDAASADADPFASASGPSVAPDEPAVPARIGWIDGHLPDLVDPLTPLHPETSLTETRRLRHDGWTPEKKRRFLERFAEGGIVVEACQAAGMSARSAYNLRDRDPLVAAGWEAAQVMARPKLADEAYSRSMNGVVERIYKDGAIVAERHRYDNRLTMAVLARLDVRIDRAEEKGAPHLALVARWDEYLAALEEDRREDGLALLAAAPAAPAAEVQGQAGDRELHELHPGGRGPAEEEEMAQIDRHDVWEAEDGWWTDYPPPPDFDGEEEGAWGDEDYRRTLSSKEQAAIDADLAEDKAADLARAQAQRAAYFGEAPDRGEPDA